MLLKDMCRKESLNYDNGSKLKIEEKNLIGFAN